jgi:hypothetical protein
MTSTTRWLNRLILFVSGAVLVVVGGTAVLWTAQPTWSQAWLSWCRETVRAATAWQVSLGARSGQTWVLDALSVLLVLAGLLVVLLGLVIWTRGRGHSDVVVHLSTDQGTTSVDHRVADGFLSRELAGRSGISSSRVTSFRVRDDHLMVVTLRVRPDADLQVVTGVARESINHWDDRLGIQVPILLHVAERSWHDRLHSTSRMA